ncbi:MAG TPA: CBS domain-containing protein [Halobacteriales archaeon]|nr:CBS domain-containing protein [Halobacteriales archaeon]
MLVSEVMTENVVTVPVDRTLGDAVRLMLEFRIGSVIVTRDGDPSGIVTETDVLIAGHQTGEPLDTIPLEEAMSHPLVTVEPAVTVRAAVERMREARVKKLPVVDGIDVVGILTQEDVVYAHPLLLQEAIHHEERRAQWDEEDEDD